MPILSSCRSIADSDFCLEKFLNENTKDANLSDDPDRTYLFIFDGLDEVDDDTELISQNLSRVFDSARKMNAKILITSRVINDESLETLVSKNSTRLELKALELNSIIGFIDNLTNDIGLVRPEFPKHFPAS